VTRDQWWLPIAALACVGLVIVVVSAVERDRHNAAVLRAYNILSDGGTIEDLGYPVIREPMSEAERDAYRNRARPHWWDDADGPTRQRVVRETERCSEMVYSYSFGLGAFPDGVRIDGSCYNWCEAEWSDMLGWSCARDWDACGRTRSVISTPCGTERVDDGGYACRMAVYDRYQDTLGRATP